MNPAVLEHIQTTASATSRGWPNRPIGLSPITHSWTSGFPNKRAAIGVSMTAGQTALTLIPFFATSSAADLVSPSTPCLVAQYAAAPELPMKPATDELLTIAPGRPCFSI